MKASIEREVPRGWPISPATVRAVLSGHGLLGLAFAAIIYLVCLTGTIAIFAPDLARWEQPGLPVVAGLDDRVLNRAVEEARRQAPAGTTLYVTLPTLAEPGGTIVAYSETFEKDWAIAADGSLVAHHMPFTDFLIDLHVALHLPHSIGGFVVGLTGVALLSSLISGILAHPRLLRDAFHLRLGGSRRLQEADWHNRLGIWALPFHFTIALTGALLGLSTIIVGVLAMLLYKGDTAQVYALFIERSPAVNAAPMPLPDIAPLLEEARRRAPGGYPRQMMIERAGQADARIAVASDRDHMLASQDMSIFDAQGRLVVDRHPQDLAVGTKILGGISQLHFGWFGGPLVRLGYGLLGLALCVVTSSGVTIWLARRRDKGRAVPLWERLWAAVIWGQPALLGLVALLALLAPEVGARWLLPLWLAGTMALLLVAGLLRTTPWAAIARPLRLAGALCFLSLAVLPLGLGTLWPAGMIGTSLVLLLLAVALVWPYRRRSPQSERARVSETTAP